MGGGTNWRTTVETLCRWLGTKDETVSGCVSSSIEAPGQGCSDSSSSDGGVWRAETRVRFVGFRKWTYSTDAMCSPNGSPANASGGAKGCYAATYFGA